MPRGDAITFAMAAQRAMLALQQFLVGPPRRFIPFPRVWPGEKMTAFQCKRTPLRSFDTPPHRILPIRGVQRLLPDIVEPGTRAPRRLLGGYSAYRLPKIWSVPGALFVGLMQQGKDQLRRFHGDFPRDLHD
jgi:hypothetical protein